MDPVIVVGAGPVGLALSLTLARYEVPSVVLDSGTGDATARAARTCVLRADTAAGLPGVPGARWHGWRTRRRRQTVHHIELDAAEAPLHVEQHVLERSLREALEHEPLAHVVTGSHLDLLEQDSDGVTAHTRSRLDEDSAERKGGTWWRGSYLVGCDGARSTVRKLLGVRFPGRTAVERHAVAALRTRLPWEGEALLHRDAEAPGEVVARPLPAGVWRLDWLLPPRGELVTPEELLARIHRTLAHWYSTCGDGEGSAPGGPADGNFAEPSAGPYELLDTGVHTCHQRLAQRWRVDRAFLAGDAAHLLGALGVQSVEEGLQDVANLAWKLSVVWHSAAGPGAQGDGTPGDALLESYQTERRGAVGDRLRAVDQSLPPVRREGSGLRALLPGGGARAHLALLTDGHLGRGVLGAPAGYERSPLLPERSAVGQVPVGTAPGAPVHNVPVTGLTGDHGQLRDRLRGLGSELLVILVAPGTGVWDSRHWLFAGMMPELAAAVATLPVRAELLVTESYPGAAAHTVLLIRADGRLVAALPGIRTEELRACAETLRGASPQRPAARTARAQ